MSDKKLDLSIIVACYNEENHLLRNVKEIEEIMGQTPYSYEFIFIDDCSKDKTREVIKKICEERNSCRYIFHEKNVGRGGTVKEGLLLSNARYAGFLDIDLEVPARYIPSMILYLNKGNDLTSVERIEKTSFNPSELLRFILSRGYHKIVQWFLKMKSPDSESGYKFFNMATMKNIIKDTKNNGWFWDTEIILRSEAADKKIKFIKGVFARQADKKSTVRIIPDTIAYIKAIVRFKKNKI